jgi:hypothetical protein
VSDRDHRIDTVEHANVRRWDGSAPGHYEVWYLTFNHRASETGYWIRYTLEAPQGGHGEPYAQLWFARFDARDPRRNFGINRRFPIATMRAEAAPFSIAIGDSKLTGDGARGGFAGGGHDVRWDLRWRPAARVHRHLPDVMYARGGIGESTVVSPNLDVALDGTLTIDGETVQLAGAPGGQTHIWGKKHAFHWAWGHCNAFVDRPGAALEALTVRLRRRGITLPPLTIFSLYLDGEVIALNQFRHTLFARARMSTGLYAFSGRNRDVRVEAEFRCRPDDMMVAPYVDPDGEPSYCANTEVGDLRVTVFRRSGVRFVEAERLLAPRSGHFEIGARERDPAVVRDHVTVG